MGNMILSSTSAQYETEIQNNIDLNGGARTIEVDDNPNSSGDFASLSGVIGDSGGGGSWTKTGVGTLYIKGAASNTYTGAATFSGGTIYLAKTGGPSLSPATSTSPTDRPEPISSSTATTKSPPPASPVLRPRFTTAILN